MASNLRLEEYLALCVTPYTLGTHSKKGMGKINVISE